MYKNLEYSGPKLLCVSRPMRRSAAEHFTYNIAHKCITVVQRAKCYWEENPQMWQKQKATWTTGCIRDWTQCSFIIVKVRMNNQSELLVLYPVYIAHRSHCEISLNCHICIIGIVSLGNTERSKVGFRGKKTKTWTWFPASVEKFCARLKVKAAKPLVQDDSANKCQVKLKGGVFKHVLHFYYPLLTLRWEASLGFFFLMGSDHKCTNFSTGLQQSSGDSSLTHVFQLHF